jgi:hypothetical protein
LNWHISFQPIPAIALPATHVDWIDNPTQTQCEASRCRRQRAGVNNALELTDRPLGHTASTTLIVHKSTSFLDRKENQVVLGEPEQLFITHI